MAAAQTLSHSVSRRPVRPIRGSDRLSSAAASPRGLLDLGDRLGDGVADHVGGHARTQQVCHRERVVRDLDHRALVVHDRRMFTTARLREDLRPAGRDHGSRAVRHAVRIAS